MPIEPTLAEVIRAAIDARLLELHTAIPAVVQSYDLSKQTADCVPVIRGAIGTDEDGTKFEELPVIPNVPVAWMRGGGYSLQFPLNKGDHVWLVFSECDISRWRESGDASEQGDLSRHSLSYPFAIPAAAPDTAPLDAIGADEAVINGPTTIRMGGPSADFLALASKVEDELAKIAHAFSTFIPGSGGASFPDAYTAPSAGATATTKLKGE